MWLLLDFLNILDEFVKFPYHILVASSIQPVFPCLTLDLFRLAKEQLSDILHLDI